jgi:hypothetical protein
MMGTGPATEAALSFVRAMARRAAQEVANRELPATGARQESDAWK